MSTPTKLCIVSIIMLYASPSEATYSIVAADQRTGQVGGAGVSCVQALDVYVIYGSAPGRGAVHAQAMLNTDGRNEAVTLLREETAPSEIIAAITSPDFDADAAIRQYGVVDLDSAAGFTGASNQPYAGDVQGSTETFTYSVQGNILTSEAVINGAEQTFTAGGGCDLADRLMLAVEAGGVDGEGDSRCTGGGIPADSGFIHVDLPDGDDYLHLSVTNTAPDNPLALLRAEYDAWRAENPCPQPIDPSDPITDEPTGGCECDAAGTPLWALAFLLWRRRSRS